MSKVIAGLFQTKAAALAAVARLEQNSFSRAHITLLNTETAGEFARRTANETAGALAGTAGGAGIAGIAGLLLGLATEGDNNDEAGRILADLDVPAGDVQMYVRSIRSGRALVIVQEESERTGEAQRILGEAGALDPESMQRKRAEETAFRQDFGSRFEHAGYTYRQFAPAYRYGVQLAGNELFRGKEWSTVETTASRDWEHENPNTWEQVKEAVRRGFLHV